MSAVLAALMLLALATALEKEVMRKVRKLRFQKTLAEETLPSFRKQ